MGQIAGPNRRLAFANSDIDVNFDVAATHVSGHWCFVVVRKGLAVLSNLNPANGNRQFIAICALTGLAYGHDNSAPICVFSGNSGFY